MTSEEFCGFSALHGPEHAGKTQIELKIRLGAQDEPRFLEKLFSEGQLVYEVEQKEHYLDNPNRSYFSKNAKGFFDATEYLRVRESVIRHPYSQDPCQGTLCYKRVHRDADGEYLYCNEYETGVSNPEHTLKILQHIGFTKEFLVEKTREVFSIGNYAISVDNVRRLGRFVEIEAIRIKHFPHEELAAIRCFVEERLGVRSYEVWTYGYVTMLLNPDCAHKMVRRHEAQRDCARGFKETPEDAAPCQEAYPSSVAQ